jgi:WD40 repeat protein
VSVAGGVLLASASFDHTVRLWDVNTGKLRAMLEGHDSWVYALDVLPNGHLVSGSYDYSVRVWDVQRSPPECITAISDAGGGFTVGPVVALPDGRVVCGCGNGALRLWDIMKVAKAGEMKGHTRDIRCMVLLRDGRVSTGGDDGRIHVWGLTRLSCEAELDGHTGTVLALVQLPDGRLASGDSGIRSLASLSGGRVASGHSDGSIRLWSPTAGGGRCDKVIKAHGGYVPALAVLPDGRIASGGGYGDHTVRITDPDRA